MIKKTIAKQTAALLCALFMLAPVPAAVAWDEVCLDFVAPQVWFTGKFQVLYGFDQLPPYDGFTRAYEFLTGQRYDYLTGKREHGRSKKPIANKEQYMARGWTDWSLLMGVGSKRCASIRDIRDGEKFVVFMRLPSQPLVDPNTTYCKPHISNPEIFYVQQDRSPYRRLWYRVWGTHDSPKCKFDHEE